MVPCMQTLIGQAGISDMCVLCVRACLCMRSSVFFVYRHWLVTDAERVVGGWNCVEGGLVARC